MTKHAMMNDEQLIEKAVSVLVREIGPVETGRFLSMPQQKRLDSVKRHHEWQDGLEKEKFFTEVFGD
ncbi:MAG: hypothetical protein V3V31_10310 [Methylococcales bacterium]